MENNKTTAQTPKQSQAIDGTAMKSAPETKTLEIKPALANIKEELNKPEPVILKLLNDKTVLISKVEAYDPDTELQRVIDYYKDKRNENYRATIDHLEAAQRKAAALVD